MHPAAKLQFERVIDEYAKWRAIGNRLQSRIDRTRQTRLQTLFEALPISVRSCGTAIMWVTRCSCRTRTITRVHTTF